MRNPRMALKKKQNKTSKQTNKLWTSGLRSFSYHAANQWNSLPDFLRTANFNDFKKVIANLDFKI